MEFIISSVVFIAVLLCFSAFFSGSETAIFSLNRIHLEQAEQEGHSSARIIKSFLEHPSKILVTILFGNQVVNILAASTAASLCVRFLGEPFGPVAATIGMTIMILICGEVTPKTFAVQNPQKFAFFACRPLLLIAQVVFPVRVLLTTLADTILSILGGTQRSHERMVTGEEFRTLLDVVQREGVLEETEKVMIDNIFDLSEITVKEIMIPREKMFCLSLDESLETILTTCTQELYARVPVYQGTLDDICGIVYIKDLLPFSRQRRDHVFHLRDMVREPYIVPASKKIQELFHEFKEKQIHLAIVQDEQGKTAGLVSLDDILQEIVGKFGEETDLAQITLPLPVEEGREYAVYAAMPVQDFNHRFGAYFSPDEYWTVGGLVLELLGKLPQKGDTVTIGDLTITVGKLRQNRIMEVTVRKGAPREQTQAC